MSSLRKKSSSSTGARITMNSTMAHMGLAAVVSATGLPADSPSMDRMKLTSIPSRLPARVRAMLSDMAASSPTAPNLAGRTASTRQGRRSRYATGMATRYMQHEPATKENHSGRTVPRGRARESTSKSTSCARVDTTGTAATASARRPSCRRSARASQGGGAGLKSKPKPKARGSKFMANAPFPAAAVRPAGICPAWGQPGAPAT